MKKDLKEMAAIYNNEQGENKEALKLVLLKKVDRMYHTPIYLDVSYDQRDHLRMIREKVYTLQNLDDSDIHMLLFYEDVMKLYLFGKLGRIIAHCHETRKKSCYNIFL